MDNCLPELPKCIIDLNVIRETAVMPDKQARYVIVLYLLFAGLAPLLSAQQSSTKLPADCPEAKKLNVMKTYTSSVPPNGNGEIKEFVNEDRKSLYRFNEEHHSAWYYFRIPSNGNLEMEIIPELLHDDYDFILYKADGDICELIRNNEIQPVRTCISRNDTTGKSKTGLSREATEEYIHSGPGASFAKSLDVEKGEHYYLVLDNFKGSGGRHKIRFNFWVKNVISGKLTSGDREKLINGKIIVADQKTGETIAETFADPESGIWRIETSLEVTRSYDIVAEADSHFFKINSISPNQVRMREIEVPEFRLELLELGRNYTLEGINFEPNVSVMTKPSLPRVHRLFTFLEQHPDININIEGHTNCAGNFFGPTELDQPLSEARAKRVYKYLTKRGIAEERLSTQGFGCTRMINPSATTLVQQMVNMRVEVRIVDRSAD